MSKNDDRILELRKRIEDKRAELSKKKIRFAPETNCILVLWDKTHNINVATENDLRLLLIRLNMYRMSAEDLGMGSASISGYPIQTWMSDIRAKLDSCEYKRKEKQLKEDEAKLTRLLSDDKKTELEIDAIEEMLKEL